MCTFGTSGRGKAFFPPSQVAFAFVLNGPPHLGEGLAKLYDER